MTNFALMSTIKESDLSGFGFVQEFDYQELDSGELFPRGCDWVLRTDKFEVIVDTYFEVKLCHRFPDTDYIQLKVEDLSDLRNVIDFITYATTN